MQKRKSKISTLASHNSPVKTVHVSVVITLQLEESTQTTQIWSTRGQKAISFPCSRDGNHQRNYSMWQAP